jgi:hypothetical protein
MKDNSKGILRNEYDLVEVDFKAYKVIPTPDYIYTPTLLSVSDFKRGKPGLALYNVRTERLVFGPEDYTKKK